MSRGGSIDLDFAGEERTFRLAWGELVKLQEEREAGPFLILTRLLGAHWMVQDLSAVIRLGLVGGGMEADKARRLVRTHVEAEVPGASLVLAQRILGAALYGTSEEDVGKKPPAANPDSSSPNSTTES